MSKKVTITATIVVDGVDAETVAGLLADRASQRQTAHELARWLRAYCSYWHIMHDLNFRIVDCDVEGVSNG